MLRRSNKLRKLEKDAITCIQTGWICDFTRCLLSDSRVTSSGYLIQYVLRIVQFNRLLQNKFVPDVTFKFRSQLWQMDSATSRSNEGKNTFEGRGCDCPVA